MLKKPTRNNPNHEYYDVNHSQAPKACYIICSTPRTGSTMLTWGLWNTGLAGFPHEYLHSEKHMAILSKRWKVSKLQDYLGILKKKRTSKNGIFGLKAHFYQFSQYFKRVSIEKFFPNLRYIYITRQNHLEQAVSLSKALQTKRWSYEERSLCKPDYNYHYILACLKQIVCEEKMWEGYFKKQNIFPLRIQYENLVQEYPNTLMEVLTYVGVKEDFTNRLAPPTTKKMANEISAQWCMQFKIDCAAIKNTADLLSPGRLKHRSSI